MSTILFFDLDGPLLDVSGRYVALHHALLESAGIRGMEAGRYWQCKRAVWSEEDILEELGAADQAGDYIRQRMELIETEAYLVHDRPWPWTISVLTSLVERHPLVVVTARARRTALLEQLKRFDLLRLFQQILSTPAGANVGEQKAGLIREFLDGNGQPAAGHWMIGDTEADIDAGKRLGLRTVAVLSGIRDQEHLRKAAPDHLLSDIRDLSFVLEKKGPGPSVDPRGV
jgi:phosphoglycolate phosphatase